MGAFRLPGVMCRMFDAVAIDVGTLCRAASAPPGTLSDEKLPETPQQEVFVDPSYEDITESVDTGFCVPLVQLSTAVGNTGRWRAGTPLTKRPELKRGTVIATFNAQGRYDSKDRGNHAAFFVEYGTRDGHAGVVIYDQYREWPDKEQKAIKALEARLQKIGAAEEGAAAKAAELRSEIATATKALEEAYPEVDEKQRRFRRKQPGSRFIAFDRKGSPSNNASAFSVVTR